MLRPSMSQILKQDESYYEFVVAVANKARQISYEAEVMGTTLDNKAVTMAVQMFASGEEKLSEIDITMDRNLH